MVDHTIEANFEIKASVVLARKEALAIRAARIDARVIEMLTQNILGPNPAPGDAVQVAKFAPMFYRAMMALPVIIEHVNREFEGQ